MAQATAEAEQDERPPPGAAAYLLTIKQAAEYAPAFPERNLRRLIDNGRVPYVRIGRRCFVDRRDLDALVERSKQHGRHRGDAA